MNTKLDSEARRKIILDGYVNNEPLKDIAARIGCSLASLKVTASKSAALERRRRRPILGAAFISRKTSDKITTS